MCIEAGKNQENPKQKEKQSEGGVITDIKNFSEQEDYFKF